LNMWMPTHMVSLVEEGLTEAGQKLEGAKIAILGVAFLENSDDARNTPSQPLYELLTKKGAKPVLHDPYVRDFDFPFTADLNEAIESADAIVIVTRHNEYLNLDLSLVLNKMRTPVLVDGRDVYKKEECEKLGFIYRGVGKPH
ncbi:UDP-N-acetyl-D-mannosamine dehydrogenase, partial [ANME-1 cluster archaeon GoMg3.2]|nr:UDP-N-acetyl-D-mannosamine dehydrogenase [ANME-1 cluster archaeon GoMg3.2]